MLPKALVIKLLTVVTILGFGGDISIRDGSSQVVIIN